MSTGLSNCASAAGGGSRARRRAAPSTRRWAIAWIACCGLLHFESSALALPPVSVTAVAQAEATEHGLHYTLDAVRISGNSRTASWVIQRYVPFQAGSLLDVDDPRLELTRYRLLGTGFFRTVSLSLEKGQQRDHVILLVEVEERNTLVVNDLWMGLAGSADSDAERTQFISAFGGLSVSEANLLGTGMTLGGATAFSEEQLAVTGRFLSAAPSKGGWMVGANLELRNALGLFGNSGVQWDDPRQSTSVPRSARVRSLRASARASLGHALSVSTQMWLHYRLESILAREMPSAAAHLSNGQLVPIDFHLLRGRSVLSTTALSVQQDTRDLPLLTTRGNHTWAHGELSLLPLGSDYSYQRLDLRSAHWWPIGRGQVFQIHAQIGAISGYAPFFERYIIGDLSDFRPGRVLGLAFDDRPAPNFLGTAISEVRYGDFSAKLGGQYRVPLYRGHRAIYGIDLFAGVGAYALAGDQELRRLDAGGEGLQRFPIDLTASFGLMLDTRFGGATFSFSNLLGMLPALGGLQ